MAAGRPHGPRRGSSQSRTRASPGRAEERRRSPSASSFSPWTGPGEPTRRACSSLETGRPSGRGRPRWLCTLCGGSCRVRDTKTRLSTGARVEGDERLRLFCALLLPPAAVDGLVAWQTAELAPRGEKLRLVSAGEPPRHARVSRLDARSSSWGRCAEALREACAGHERPLFAVGRYRETRSVAMIVLDGRRRPRREDRGRALRRSRTARPLPARGAPLASARHVAALSRAVRGSARRFPSSARSLRPTRP